MVGGEHVTTKMHRETDRQVCGKFGDDFWAQNKSCTIN